MDSNLPAPNKRVWLYSQLVELIANGKEGDRLPSYNAMIRRYNVAQGTIDNVLEKLTNEGRLKRERRKGIYIAARAKQRCFGLVFEWEMRGPFDRRLIERCRARASASSARFSFYIHVPLEGEGIADNVDLAEDVALRKLEGVVLLGVEDEAIFQILAAKDVPHVLFSSFSDRKPRVAIDYRNLIEQGVGALAFTGSRRIGLVTPHGPTRLKDPSFREDIEAFQAALAAHGFEFIPEAVVERRTDIDQVPRPTRESNMEMGYWAATELFGGDKVNRLGLDGVVVMDEFFTKGMILAFEKLGICAPGDVRIASHASKDCSPLRGLGGNLILLEVDVEAVVDALFQLLEEWMHQGNPPLRVHRLPVSLRLPAATLASARSA